LDIRGEGRVRANRRRVDSHLRRHALARTVIDVALERAAGACAHTHRTTRVNVSHATPHMPGESPLETELRSLFHRLNNQLGIILAHAELLEAKADDDTNRARAAQMVTSALDAMGTAREIRQRTEPMGL